MLPSNIMFDSAHCHELSHPNIPVFIISLLILIGIPVSYFPQHYRIIHRRSSEGISPYWLLLGATGGTCMLTCILVRSKEDIGCCRVVGGFACFSAILGVLQAFAQWLCFAITLTLFTIYFPRATPLLPAPDLHHPNKASPPSYNVAITVTLVFVVELVFTIFYGSGIWISGRQGLLDSFAFVNGIFAAILSLLQYFPQIWTTFELKHVGSLSIPMMCIQIPGSLLWAASYVVRLGWSAFDAWGVLALTALFQACLLAMAVIFELRDRRQRKKGMDGMNGIEDEASEETPLLHD